MQFSFGLLLLLAPYLAASSPLANANLEADLLKRTCINCPGYGQCCGPSPFCQNLYYTCGSNYKKLARDADAELGKRVCTNCPGIGACCGPSPFCQKNYRSCGSNY